MTLHEELIQFRDKIQVFVSQNCPGFLTPNSTFMGISPGNNLDVLQIGFDFRVERLAILKMEVPPELEDPSKANLKVVKDVK